jgi:DNA-binding GntR family transcriptional regulator/anti-sigma regulatory factor (Ser/Thr protein kinase)
MAQPGGMTRTERAYRHLVAEINRGRWQAGDTLSTYALAEELEMSRTPVLEALKRLEGDGLVEIIPQVGCRIVAQSRGAVEELLAVREGLEGLAASAAATHADDDALADLEATLRRLERAAQGGNRGAYDELHQRFHLGVAAASGMPRLADALRSVWAPLRYQLARLPLSEEQLRNAVAEHRDVFEAVRRGAAKSARAAAERHVRMSVARYLGYLEGAHGLVHQALIYADEPEFLASTVPFVQGGLEQGERVLAVTTARNAEVLGRELGADASEVEFRDAHEWYELPAHTLVSYERYLEHADRGRVRVVGEVAWDGELSAPISEWTRYEAVINAAFALEPVSFLCPYDAGRLPERVVADARRTHPQLCENGTASANPQYTDVATLTRELEAEALAEPEGPTAEHPVTADLRGVRGFVLDQAHRAGVGGKALEDAFLAVQEVLANVAAHGPGRGTIRAWVQDRALVFEVSDDGTASGDPLLGRPMASDVTAMGGAAGLWMARLLCDLVEVRSRNGGVVVRLHVALD